jgi:hypothetical protein
MEGEFNDDRLIGVQNTFRYPQEVDDLIKKEQNRREAEWLNTPRNKRGYKPTIDALVSELLRKGIVATDTITIADEWHPEINKVHIPKTTEKEISKRVRSYENRETA